MRASRAGVRRAGRRSRLGRRHWKAQHETAALAGAVAEGGPLAPLQVLGAQSNQRSDRVTRQFDVLARVGDGSNGVELRYGKRDFIRHGASRAATNMRNDISEMIQDDTA